MIKIILSFLLSGFFLCSAEEISAAGYARLVAKGERIAIKLCEHSRLPAVKGSDSAKEISDAVKESGACPSMSRKNMRALVAFLKAGGRSDRKMTGNEIKVPAEAKCPVCGMFVSKYPKWAAEMSIDGKKHFFDGVKDMMKYYIFDVDFPYDRKKIEYMKVSDFYTLESIDAYKAWYVLGSDVYGPMGNELIPFKDKASAENFAKDHKGERIIRFENITAKMVMALDGVEYNE